MGQIQVMSPALANQIAAGEVVERPASCVKELIENSLDAGATKITVKLEEGGISLIAVEDDGRGMNRDDAVLAFARHATSKLTTAYDLTRIQTLGFRGEALASIAAVAKVALQTRSADSEHGWEVTAEGSDATSDPVAIGRAIGTKVQVRDLFFNTPARLKYLRTVHTEQARCVEVVQRAALSRPDVAFRCDVDDRVLFQTPGKDSILDVLAVLYGVGEARQFLNIDMSTPDYHVYGFVGRPTQGKSSRAHGNWFINGRSIRNIGLHQAVVAGYQGRLMINRQPMYALYITMDPTLVDVNIHPHKSEVRFSEERDVTRLVQQAVADALNAAFLVPSVSRTDLQKSQGASNGVPGLQDGDSPVSERRPQYGHSPSRHVNYPNRPSSPSQERSHQQSLPLVQREQPSPKEIAAASHIYERPQRTEHGFGHDSDFQDGHREGPAIASSEVRGPSHVPDSSTPIATSETNFGTNASEGKVDARTVLSQLRPVGQVLGTYILAEADNALFVIDQHAAHERVLYERFRTQMEAAETPMLPLLTPITMRLLPQQLAVLKQYMDVLLSLGITVEEFGGSEVIVRTIPQVWEGLDAASLLEDILLQLGRADSKVNPREALREKIIMRACKSAIKANHHLSEMEIRALCEALPKLDDPFHCPHGRPVFIRLSNKDLEREFRRIV